MDSYPRLQWETFIVRLYRETTGQAWRGEIVHLPDHEARHFATLEQALDFIAHFAPGIQAQSRDGDAIS